MRILFIILALILIATPAFANSSYTYTLTHDLELHLDGDFEFKSNVTTPSQGTVDIELEGVGEAFMRSQLEIFEASKVSSNWFDLF